MDSDKVLMEFIVKAGDRNEDMDQKQVAHATEHIPFYKTKNYPKGILEVHNKNKLGINSAMVRANTSYDYTRYYFNFQRKNMDAFNEGLLWFKEIANNLRFDQEIIDHVTREVFEEIRFRTRGTMTSKHNDYGSKIFPGLKDLSNPDKFLNEHTPQEFTRFYEDWYRPENMAILIVGNIDMKEVEITSVH